MTKLLIALFLCLTALSAQADHNPLPITGKDVVKGEQVQFDATGAGADGDSEKPQVVVFLSQKCPCSNSHIDELKKLANDYKDVRFVAVHSNIDEEPDKVKEYFTKLELPFPVVQDDNNKIADRFKASKTPHAYVISKNEIVYRGGVSDSKSYRPENRLYLREALEDLKNHRPLRTPEARTLGCAIPRS